MANTPAFAEQQYGRIKYRLPNYKKEDLPTAGDTGIYKCLTAGVIMLTAGSVLVLIAIKRKRRE
ncbi:MAG: LPXTG cell wall anchor domain-containing protein [Oscillospiraceae bacterium]|nr:LPXTG cell wall anchor domain-containing protein [Oscillospiraceae bacterium]